MSQCFFNSATVFGVMRCDRPPEVVWGGGVVVV